MALATFKEAQEAAVELAEGEMVSTPAAVVVVEVLAAAYYSLRRRQFQTAGLFAPMEATAGMDALRPQETSAVEVVARGVAAASFT